MRTIQENRLKHEFQRAQKVARQHCVLWPLNDEKLISQYYKLRPDEKPKVKINVHTGRLTIWDKDLRSWECL